MATAPSSSEGLAVATWGDGTPDQASKSDRYLARRLAEASADFKSVAFTTFLLGASVAAIGWLACGVLLEHWIVPGGLPAWARWVWLGTGAAALVAGIVRWLVPLIRYRVNLVYAARALEAEHPELHNDLVNTVLVKARGGAPGDAVLRSLERRAARRLSKVPNDGTVDRTVAVRLAVALMLLVAAACLYEVAAPKSLLQSAARLLAPWSAITAPARVRIEPPRLAWRQPGDGAAVEDDPARRLEQTAGMVTLVRGRQVVVTSGIRGLSGEERPLLLVTPARDDGTIDAAAQPWRVEMKPAAGDGRYRGVLPDPSRGLEHGVELVILAGDARSERVRVAVVDTPALLVREVRYDYPAYTGLGSDTVAWQGDLRAVEGTRATIIAEGNRPLKSAWIDLDCDGKPDKELRVAAHDLARASGTIELRLDATGSGPAHGSYRLMFTPRAAAGAAREDAVLEKLEHRIEVLPDLPPEVSIEEPREPVVSVPPGAPVTIRVRALDPDFGLARVVLETRLREGAAGPVVPLFDATAAAGRNAAEQGRRGAVAAATQLVPERFGATPGSVLEYRAVATDTRPREPNVRATPWQALKIDPSAPPRQPDVPPPAEQPQANPDPSRDSGKQEGQDTNGEGDSGQQGGGGDTGDAGGGGDGDGQSADGKEQSSEGKSSDGKSSEGKGQSAANDGTGNDSGAGRNPAAADGQGDKPADPPGTNESGSGESQQARDQQGKDQQGKDQQGKDQQQAGDGQRGNDQAQKNSHQAQKDGERQQQGTQREPDNAQARNSPAERAQAEPPEGSAQPGERKPAETVAADGTNDGEAFERILEQRQREAPQQDAAQQPNQQQPNQQQCKDADGKPCGKESCSTCQGQGQGQGKDGQEQQGQQGKGQQGQEEQQGQGQQGQGEDGQGQQGQGQQGQGAAGDGQPGGGQPSPQTAAGNERGGPQAEGQRQTEGQQGEGQAAGGKQEGAQPGGKAGEQAGESQQAAGDQAGSEKTAGSNAAGSDAAGIGDKTPDAKPGAGQAADGTKPGAAGEQAAGEQDAGQQDVAAAGETGEGGEAAGSTAAGALGGANGRLPADGPVGSRETEWTDQDLTHARNAADLALAHLRDSLAAGRTDVLDALGWTPEQARAFLERWQSLRQMAKSGDPRERGEFEQTLKSLGLRPGGVQSSRDVPADAKGGQAEGRRGRPPASYREQFQAFLRGTGGE